MNQSVILEQIKSYVEGKLSLEQQQTFETKLASNPEWQSAYESYFATQKVLDKIALKELKSTLKNVISEKPVAKRIPLIPKWYKIAAAVLLLIFASTFLFQNFFYSNQRIATSAYIAPLSIFPELSSSRNEGSNDKEWQQILAFFQKEDYEKTISLLLQSTESTPAQSFLLANAYFKNKQTKLALQTLDNFQPKNKKYQEAKDWLIALTYLFQNEINTCQQQLIVIINKNPDHIFKNQAIQLQEKIKN